MCLNRLAFARIQLRSIISISNTPPSCYGYINNCFFSLVYEQSFLQGSLVYEWSFLMVIFACALTDAFARIQLRSIISISNTPPSCYGYINNCFFSLVYEQSFLQGSLVYEWSFLMVIFACALTDAFARIQLRSIISISNTPSSCYGYVNNCFFSLVYVYYTTAKAQLLRFPGRLKTTHPITLLYIRKRAWLSN